MELSKTTFLLVHAYRFVAFTFVAGMVLTPRVPFPNGKGADRRCVLQRATAARKENIVVLCGGAPQQRPCIS